MNSKTKSRCRIIVHWIEAQTVSYLNELTTNSPYIDRSMHGNLRWLVRLLNGKVLQTSNCEWKCLMKHLNVRLPWSLTCESELIYSFLRFICKNLQGTANELHTSTCIVTVSSTFQRDSGISILLILRMIFSLNWALSRIRLNLYKINGYTRETLHCTNTHVFLEQKT